MIDSILLVDDEDLFHLVFEDACSLLDITLSLEGLTSADENFLRGYLKVRVRKDQNVFLSI